MNIWVDADACPAVIKEILFRAAERLQVPMTLVANKPLRTPSSRYIRMMQVGSGLDVADLEITRRLEPGDLVITADIPLAADVIARGGHALNPRGEFYTSENVREHLSMRDFMEALRGSGVRTGGPDPLGQADRKRFADQLDRFTRRRAPVGGDREPATGAGTAWDTVANGPCPQRAAAAPAGDAEGAT